MTYFFARLKRFYEFNQTKYIGYFFLLPAITLFAIFSWYPIISGFVISFMDYSFNPNIPSKFVGFQNYQKMFSDPLFYKAWINVFIFVGLGLLIGYAIPIVLAITINEMRRLRGFFRLGFYLPAILPLVVVVVMWKYLYGPEYGFIDTMFKVLHLQPISNGLINNKNTAMLALVIMSTWKNAGATIIIYLAALQGIPEQLYEAAELDGANIWQRVKHITIPQILYVMLILLILQIIGTVKVFVEPFIMTKGGPNNATLTVVLRIYNIAFRYYDMGWATAMCLMLFVVLIIVTYIYVKLTRKLSE